MKALDGTSKGEATGAGLSELVSAVAGVELVRGDGAAQVERVVYDSREAGPGALFVALRGAHVDGHDYLEAARDAGARAVLVEDVERVPEGMDGVLRARDTRRVLGDISALLWGDPSASMQVVGVTGTNGKTTTCWMLERLLVAAGGEVGVIGTVNHRWGDVEIPAVNTTPESARVQQLLSQMRRDGVNQVAMEVSSHGLATHRLRGTHFDVGIFTNLSQDHLDFHGSMKAYREAKARLFTELLPRAVDRGKRPVAVINLEDQAGRDLFEACEGLEGVRRIGFGRAADAEYRVREVRSSLEGVEFCLEMPEGSVSLMVPIIGDFNVLNATGAWVAAKAVVGEGADDLALAGALATLPQIPGRMERVRGGPSEPAVFVDYAHTPDALGRALEQLRPLAGGELVVVFGAGGDRDRSKRAQMGRAAAAGSDRVVVTSDNPRFEDPGSIIADILAGVESVGGVKTLEVEVDRACAIEGAIRGASVDDIVLIAGKGHETYQEVGGVRRAFDDREQARRAMAGRGEKRV